MLSGLTHVLSGKGAYHCIFSTDPESPNLRPYKPLKLHFFFFFAKLQILARLRSDRSQKFRPQAHNFIILV